MAKQKNMLIGEMLVEEGIITKEQLKDGLEEQKRTGEKIGEILIRMGYITKEILWTFLGYQMGVAYMNLDELPQIRQDVLKTLPEQLMRNEKLIPVNKQGKMLTVAMADPLNFLVVDDLKATTRCEIDARLAPADDIKKSLDKYFGYKEEDRGEIARARVDELDDILSAPLNARRPEPRRDAPQSTDTGKINIQRSVYGQQPQQRSEAAPVPQPAYQPPVQNYAPPPQQYAPPPEPQYEPPPPPPPQRMQETPPQTAQAVMSGDTPVNAFLTTLLAEAFEAGSSDIHIEPMADKCRIRRRIDGVLYEVDSPPKTLYAGILNKIKELSQMNPAEKGAPQESKLKIRITGREINLAVHTFPTIYGEKIALRIIRADDSVIPLDSIGLENDVLDIFKKILKLPHGLLIIAGPTNSGKETTMYSAISEINDPSLNVFSIDDSSSNCIIPGINQAKVNRRNNGQVLRYLSEQDCDVIALGDISNKETGEAVFDIIASGHLLITKLRAGDPYQALQTIINYGIEPYVVYSNANAVLAQRLVRKICDRCKETYEAPDEVVKMLGDTGKAVLYRGKGCDACSHTGYKGRTAVFELLPLTEKIKEMLLSGEPLKKVKEENKKQGMNTLKESALLKVLKGITTIEEYMKIS